MSASPETGSEKHRDRARRYALQIPAPCVCVETPLCNQHKAIEAKVIAALARVEAETRRQFEDERAALRAVLTPLRELAAKATPGPLVLRFGNIIFAGNAEIARPGIACDFYDDDSPAEMSRKSAAAIAVNDANAELFVALVNALPALLNALAPEPVAGDAHPKSDGS